MAKTAAGRKLGRKPGARTSLLRQLTVELFRNEQIKTTIAKAKECSRMANHLIAVAKRGDLNARRSVARDIHDSNVQQKLFDVLATRYANRDGGATRLFRLPTRQGDNAAMALLRLIA